jgi:hypothetical protein
MKRAYLAEKAYREDTLNRALKVDPIFHSPVPSQGLLRS